MASHRSGSTPADHVIVAISPVLIMALVGSLVFFLLEVLYAGQYPGRMQWILFFFVFGAVLIARISMMGEIANRAGLYALVLGLLVWLGLQAFVEYPAGSALAKVSWFVNLGLLVLIWWCAHRLTWDCTFIDESTDATGQGLLQAAGLDRPAPASGEEPADSTDAGDGKKPLGWWERYQRHRQERRRQHTPGVWVVYFSLAALPLFGLGQALIPPGEVGRRRYAFWLLGIYVASGLGLLLTTAFLGLRRYLRQRGLQMPAAVTSVWLSLGVLLIGALLAAGALLPRPQAEYSLVPLGRLGSPDRDASRYALKRDGSGKGEGRPSSDQQGTDPDSGSGAGKQEGQAGGKEPGKSSGKGDGKEKDGASGQGDRKGQGGTSEQGSSKDGSGKDPAAGSGDKQGQQGSGRGGSPRDQGSARQANDQAGGQEGDRPSSQGAPRSEAPQSHPGGGSSPASGSPLSGIASALGSLMEVLRWIVFVVLALLVAVVVLWALLRFLANFTGWARGLLDSLRTLWESLFGRRREEAAGAAEEIAPGPTPPPAFSSFSNPFLDGSADRLPADELVRYSFAALQSWAWERGLGREMGETPLEFAGRLGTELPSLETESRQLAALFARAAYARGPLPAGWRDAVQQFWQRLEAVTEQPLSA